MKKRVSWAERALLIWILVFIIGHGILGLGIAKVSGSSMASTFEDGDYVFLAAVHDYTSLQRGDVITFHPETGDKRIFIKRIVGLPGEMIEADDNSVLANGVEVSFWHGTGTWGPIMIPDDAVFVLGDNRGVSCDSRQFGCVPLQQVYAKVLGDCSRK